MAGPKYESVRDRRERIAMGEDAAKFRAPNGTVPKRPPVGIIEKTTAAIEGAHKKLDEWTGKKRK